MSRTASKFLDGEASTPNSSNTLTEVAHVYVTSYNPEAGQTDSTPCIAGGTGMDLCQMAKDGIRTIALSQDLAGWSTLAKSNALEAGTEVWLESKDFPDDSRCNGKFIVADAMNARYTNRADLFFMDRADNISCNAIILTPQ